MLQPLPFALIRGNGALLLNSQESCTTHNPHVHTCPPLHALLTVPSGGLSPEPCARANARRGVGYSQTTSERTSRHTIHSPRPTLPPSSLPPTGFLTGVRRPLEEVEAGGSLTLLLGRRKVQIVEPLSPPSPFVSGHWRPLYSPPPFSLVVQLLIPVHPVFVIVPSSQLAVVASRRASRLLYINKPFPSLSLSRSVIPDISAGPPPIIVCHPACRESYILPISTSITDWSSSLDTRHQRFLMPP